jgi:hypothetical protein
VPLNRLAVNILFFTSADLKGEALVVAVVYTALHPQPPHHS